MSDSSFKCKCAIFTAQMRNFKKFNPELLKDLPIFGFLTFSRCLSLHFQKFCFACVTHVFGSNITYVYEYFSLKKWSSWRVESRLLPFGKCYFIINKTPFNIYDKNMPQSKFARLSIRWDSLLTGWTKINLVK